MPVYNVPTYGENTVAEHTFAMILALSRNTTKAYTPGIGGAISRPKAFRASTSRARPAFGVVGTGHIGLPHRDLHREGI